MGNSEVTRLIGPDSEGRHFIYRDCVTDVLPMSLDWYAAGTPLVFIGRALDRIKAPATVLPANPDFEDDTP